MANAFLLDSELRKQRYAAAKKAKKEDFVQCPSCEKVFKKKRATQAFCSTGCKIKYWNRTK